MLAKKTAHACKLEISIALAHLNALKSSAESQGAPLEIKIVPATAILPAIKKVMNGSCVKMAYAKKHPVNKAPSVVAVSRGIPALKDFYAKAVKKKIKYAIFRAVNLAIKTAAAKVIEPAIRTRMAIL